MKLLPGGQFRTAECSLSSEEETLKLTFPKALPPGDAELTIDFVGELNGLVKGFYHNKYTQ